MVRRALVGRWLTPVFFGMCVVSPAVALGGGGNVLGAAATGSSSYPSPYGTAKLPDGFLIQVESGDDVYLIRGGKKSLVHQSILNRWLQEMHYIKHDVIIRLPAAELATYATTSPRNLFAQGKILTAGGTRYFIDDRLRKRPIAPPIQAALRYPKRNVYDVPQSLLDAYPDGPAITATNRHPGGTVMYFGPYHGGKLYLIRGDDTKHEFLSDYVYEAMGFAWSSQILPVTAEELGRYRRGAHLSTYPDGWIIGKSGKHYLVQGNALRWIASKALFTALGYNPRYVWTVLPQFFKNYDIGKTITAFKKIRAAVAADVNPAAGLAPRRLAGALSTLPASVQQLMSKVNRIFLEVHDRNPTPAENRFWIAYINDEKPGSESALAAAMRARRNK